MNSQNAVVLITGANCGICASSGSPSSSLEQMADGAITVIKVKGLQKVDRVGFLLTGARTVIGMHTHRPHWHTRGAHK